MSQSRHRQQQELVRRPVTPPSLAANVAEATASRNRQRRAWQVLRWRVMSKLSLVLSLPMMRWPMPPTWGAMALVPTVAMMTACWPGGAAHLAPPAMVAARMMPAAAGLMMV